jgi:hypothetical protein
MPFIKGRYHINPIAGQALEAAREAEAALLALEHAAQQNRASDADSGADAGSGDDDVLFASRFDRDASRQNDASPGPIHRVEIEAAETMPHDSSHATRGFVARVHRAPVVPPVGAQSAEADVRAAPSHLNHSPLNQSPAPETHVFAGHRDLISFLRDEFAKDCAR